MRRCCVHNQSLDRQRLSFATCRNCKGTVAVFGVEGQDVGHVLYENGFRLPSAIALEIEMECVSCYSWLFVSAPDFKTYDELKEEFDKLMYGYFSG
jgi:hypothetical protein